MRAFYSGALVSRAFYVFGARLEREVIQQLQVDARWVPLDVDFRYLVFQPAVRKEHVVWLSLELRSSGVSVNDTLALLQDLSKIHCTFGVCIRVELQL